MVVRDVMTDYFASAHISSTVSDAVDKMLAEGLDNLLIVDDRNQLVGRIEESLMMVAALDSQWLAQSVNLHMERNFVTIRPDETVGQVVEKFLLHQASDFPVLEEGKLIGVLTRRQLLRAVLSQNHLKAPPRKVTSSVA